MLEIIFRAQRQQLLVIRTNLRGVDNINILEQDAEHIVISDRSIDYLWGNSLCAGLFNRLRCEIQHFIAQILHDGGHVNSGVTRNPALTQLSFRRLALRCTTFQHAVNSSNRENQACLLRTRLVLVFLSLFGHQNMEWRLFWYDSMRELLHLHFKRNKAKILSFPSSKIAHFSLNFCKPVAFAELCGHILAGIPAGAR